MQKSTSDANHKTAVVRADANDTTAKSVNRLEMCASIEVALRLEICRHAVWTSALLITCARLIH